MASPHSRLLDLADELLVDIVEYLDGDHLSLRALALTSSQLQGFAEPVLYRRYFVHTPYSLSRLLHSAVIRQREHIQVLDARCKFSLVDDNPWKALPRLIEHARKLQDLTIESPLCNEDHWAGEHSPVHREYPEVLASLSLLFHRAACRDATVAPDDRPLRNLRRLELHMNGVNQRYWQIQEHSRSLFTSPTIEDLTISCAQFDLAEFGTELPKATTPLKRLTLIECNLTLLAVWCILRMPKALQYLHLGTSIR